MKIIFQKALKIKIGDPIRHLRKTDYYRHTKEQCRQPYRRTKQPDWMSRSTNKVSVQPDRLSRHLHAVKTVRQNVRTLMPFKSQNNCADSQMNCLRNQTKCINSNRRSRRSESIPEQPARRFKHLDRPSGLWDRQCN